MALTLGGTSLAPPKAEGGCTEGRLLVGSQERNLDGGMKRKTRLPDASRAGQGDDSDIVLSKPGNDCGDFMIAANERRSRPQQGGMECACMCRTRRQWGQAMLGSLM